MLTGVAISEQALAKRTWRIELPTLTSFCTMGVVLWCSTAILLDRVVKPYLSPDQGRTFVFDPVALVEATSVIAGPQ
jgi:hypothetical protein